MQNGTKNLLNFFGIRTCEQHFKSTFLWAVCFRNKEIQFDEMKKIEITNTEKIF